MRLGAHSEHVLAVEEDRDENCVIGRMRIPHIWVVVEKRIAFGQIGMQLLHRNRLQVRPENMDG